MKVIDLGDEHRALFATCLEDWSDDAREAGDRRARWVDDALGRGLRAHLALDDAGTVGAMIQHLPIEESNVDGAGLRFIPCVWVHGHKQGRGDFRGHGMGSALLETAEADARARGALGMVAWGLWLPFWMRASWFKRHGYRKADRRGIAVLVWKPFSPEAKPPRWLPEVKRLPPPAAGKVNVTIFGSGWCMAMNLVAARARRAAAELGDRVQVTEIVTTRRAAVAEWGQSDAVFVDGRQVGGGPPMSYEKMRRILAKRVEKIGR